MLILMDIQLNKLNIFKNQTLISFQLFPHMNYMGESGQVEG